MMRGRVLGERTGKPIPTWGVIVKFDDNHGALASSSTGDFSMRGRLPGVCVLEAQTIGYEKERRIVVITCPTREQACRTGGATVNFRLRLVPHYP
jgi:hypothetical protein